MTKSNVYTETVIRGFAEVAVSSPETFEAISATLPAEVLETVSAVVLVIESEKAASVIEKVLVAESEREEDFGDHVARFLNLSNELADETRHVIKLQAQQGRGDSMVRKVTFPTRYGALTIVLK